MLLGPTSPLAIYEFMRAQERAIGHAEGHAAGRLEAVVEHALANPEARAELERVQAAIAMATRTLRDLDYRARSLSPKPPAARAKKRRNVVAAWT